MKISVITPSFNQAKFLEATMESVLSQGYPNLEYIVIDGGSTDGSVRLLERYSDRLTYWVSEKDRGQSHAFNKGLQRASGEIIGWINSDDLYQNRALFQGAEFLTRNPAVDIVFSDYWYIDEQGRFLHRRKEIPFHPAIYLWTEDCFHANCAGFFRRRVFDTLNGLDEEIHFGMDYEFYLRASQAGMKFAHVHDCWGAYRLHGASKSVASHHMQIRDAVSIKARYQPKGISPLGAWMRAKFFRAVRIVWKCLIGSYLPVNYRSPA